MKLVSSYIRAFLRSSRSISTTGIGLAQTAAKPGCSSEKEAFDELWNEVYGSRHSIDKIEVNVNINDSSKVLLLNKNTSTPLSCAKHISHSLARNSAIALVDDCDLVSMRTPLQGNCSLQFANFNSQEPILANGVQEAFWRSAAAVLAAGVMSSFTSPVDVRIGQTEVSSGYFSVKVFDNDWTPSKDDLRQIALYCHQEIIGGDIPIEVICVPDGLAVQHGFSNRATLCRIGDFVTEISGPTISSTSQIGRFNILKAVRRDNYIEVGGIAIPASTPLASKAFEIIKDYANKKFS